MTISLSYLPSTILSGAPLTSWSTLQAAWFGRFWAWAGPQVRSSAEASVIPLLQGRVSAGRIIPPGPSSDESTSTAAARDDHWQHDRACRAPSPQSQRLHPGVAGTVLEIGPGSGMWVSIFSDLYAASPSSESSSKDANTTTSSSSPPGPPPPGQRGTITRVYGVEPNPAVHPLLRRQIAAADLEGVYEVVPFGIESLASSGRIPRQSVDCIVSVLCLCSIPDPELNIRELYGYLKPGGRWYVYEHVRQARSKPWPVRAYQCEY